MRRSEGEQEWCDSRKRPLSWLTQRQPRPSLMRGGSCVCVSKSVRLQYVCAALKLGRRPEATVSCFCSQLCEGRMWCETTGRCSCTAPQLETRERECVMAEFLDMDVCVCVCAVCWALADSYESITLICQLPPLIQLITVMRTDVCTCRHGRLASPTELQRQAGQRSSGWTLLLTKTH